MFRDDTFQNANNKGADQSGSARMPRPVCPFVVCKPLKQAFRVEAHMVLCMCVKYPFLMSLETFFSSADFFKSTFPKFQEIQ